MLERHVDGEPEEFARLRGKIVELCEIERFNRVMNILREHAKSNGISMQKALHIWETSKCPNLMQESGMREYNRVFEREMNKF